MSLSAEFRDYKLKKESEIKDLMAHEAELRQEARIYQRDLQKLEKDYASVIAKLADKEDKIVELKGALKKLESTLQQKPLLTWLHLENNPLSKDTIEKKCLSRRKTILPPWPNPLQCLTSQLIA